MAKYVLTSDSTLAYDFRNFPLLDFLPCAPGGSVPYPVYKFLKGTVKGAKNGTMKYAPYGLRKIEAALLKTNRREDVVVAHPDRIGRFIGPDTKIVGIHTMDPLGIGPVTMSYFALFKPAVLKPLVRIDWERLIYKINAVRKNTGAKLVVGGPGVWEYMLLREELDNHNIDYVFQGELDDVAGTLFNQIENGSIDPNTFSRSYVTYDDTFHRVLKEDPKFISRGKGLNTFPKLEDIPNIVGPTTKSLTEVMRGCGIGCDFCEVTLRESRYYPVEKIVDEVKVNVQQGGFTNAWLHSDEIFAYKHLPKFVPNEDALVELFKGVLAIPGIKTANPTHGRISIPAAFPDLIRKLSEVIKPGKKWWVGVQVGLETGSDTLAKKHMPAKTLPLQIGVDGTWQEIVWKGVYNFNKYYWRPAFTVQVGQREETDEDNWETVALINRLSNSVVDGRPFEFTVTPLLNVPLGKIKAKNMDAKLTQSMMAVYYASYRHLAKMAQRDAMETAVGNFAARYGVAGTIVIGGHLMFKYVAHEAAKMGVDIGKVKTYGVGRNRDIQAWSVAVAN